MSLGTNAHPSFRWSWRPSPVNRGAPSHPSRHRTTPGGLATQVQAGPRHTPGLCPRLGGAAARLQVAGRLQGLLRNYSVSTIKESKYLNISFTSDYKVGLHSCKSFTSIFTAAYLTRSGFPTRSLLASVMLSCIHRTLLFRFSYRPHITAVKPGHSYIWDPRATEPGT